MAPVLSSGLGSLLHVGALKASAGTISLFELLSALSLCVLAASIARLVQIQRHTAQQRERLLMRQRETQLLGLAARRVWEHDR
jgi:hypothetical protein